MSAKKKPKATKVAKLFQNGGSQAVRLPKEYRFEDQEEVLIRREGDRIILEPVDQWSESFLACLGSWDEEIDRPDQGDLSGLKDPFA
jgi:antitoxin VapB